MQQHTVSKGETMEGIARKYGFPNASVVFDAPCNRGLKLLRSRANNIKAGDTVTIPPNALVAAQKKLETLRKIRVEHLELNRKIKEEWNNEYRKINNVKEGVDTAKTVLTILVSLRDMIKAGGEAIKLSGKALEEANKKLAKSVIKSGYEPLGELVIEQTSKVLSESANSNDSDLVLFGKFLGQYLVDVQTPSFWTSQFTGVDIEATNIKVNQDIDAQRERILKRLDASISRAEFDLDRIRRSFNGVSVLHY